jgi:hypothetical protein
VLGSFPFRKKEKKGTFGEIYFVQNSENGQKTNAETQPLCMHA